VTENRAGTFSLSGAAAGGCQLGSYAETNSYFGVVLRRACNSLYSHSGVLRIFQQQTQ
jgi:hypothetical protein